MTTKGNKEDFLIFASAIRRLSSLLIPQQLALTRPFRDSWILGPQRFQRCLFVAYSAAWCMWGRGKAQPWFKSLHNLSVWVLAQIILSVLRHFIAFSLNTSLPFFLPESDGQDVECGPSGGFPSEWGGREAGGGGGWWIVSRRVLQWEGRGSRSCLLELRDARRELTMGGEGYRQGRSGSSGVIPSSHHIHSCWGRAGWEGEGTEKTLLPWCTLLKHAGLLGLELNAHNEADTLVNHRGVAVQHGWMEQWELSSVNEPVLQTKRLLFNKCKWKDTWFTSIFPQPALRWLMSF